MTYFAMNLKGNTKTQIPTTTSAKDTCPNTCPLKEKGCYARYSFLGNYWKKLSNGEVKNSFNFKELLKAVKQLNEGALWRHNQAGDLMHNDGEIDSQALTALVKANKGRKGFTYTHHKLDIANNALNLAIANDNGFTVNISCDNLQEADKVFNQYDDLPVVTLLPMDSSKVSYTESGNKVIACPAEGSKKVSCKTCKLCSISDRDYIIGFRAHGTAKKSVEIIAKG